MILARTLVASCRDSCQQATRCWLLYLRPRRRRYVLSVLDLLNLESEDMAGVTGCHTGELLGLSGDGARHLSGAKVVPRFGFPPKL
jgi:hypothetical protein